MKKIVFLLFLLSPYIAAQNIEYEVYISDVNKEDPYLSWITIDDSITISPINFIESKDTIAFKVVLSLGKHHFSSSFGEYKILDSLVFLSKESTKINLSINMMNDFHLYEFREGFEKVYTRGVGGTIIGLKEDSTFLMKRFIYKGYAIAHLFFEKGYYTLRNETLTLHINEASYNNMDNFQPKFYNYDFQLKNDKITDIDKYGSEIGRLPIYESNKEE